jgi:hypothetical protein
MKLRAFLYALAGVAWLAIPIIVLAQTTGSASSGNLVPCAGAADCNLCTFGQLIQNVINYVIGLSIPLAALLFAWAGWLYFSNHEDTSRIAQAHRIFTTVFIGFVIAVSAWLIVQTILKALAPGYQSWTTFNCTQQRPLSGNIGDLLNNVLGKPSALAPANNLAYGCQSGTLRGDGCYNGDQLIGPATLQSNSSVALTCADNFTGDLRVVNGKCVDENDHVVSDAIPVSASYGVKSSQCAPENPACSVDVLLSYGYEQAEADAMSCIAVTESSGNPYTKPSVTGACGLFQITRGNWSNPKYHEGPCSAATSCNDPFCNAQAAQLMFNEQGYQPWTGICDNPSGCGVVQYQQAWNPNARTCVQKYDPAAYTEQVAQ